MVVSSPYKVAFVAGEVSFLEGLTQLIGDRLPPLCKAPADLLSGVSALQRNDTALAVVHIPAPPTLRLLPGKRFLVLCDVRDPGNLGTMIRIADWYALDGIICSPRTVDMYNEKVIQASMGSFLHVPVHYMPLLPLLQEASLPILAASLSGTEWLGEHSLPAEGLLLIGNESHGLPEPLLTLATRQVRIRRYGQADSLNAAIAAALFCEAWRRPGGGAG